MYLKGFSFLMIGDLDKHIGLVHLVSVIDLLSGSFSLSNHVICSTIFLILILIELKLHHLTVLLVNYSFFRLSSAAKKQKKNDYFHDFCM